MRKVASSGLLNGWHLLVINYKNSSGTPAIRSTKFLPMTIAGVVVAILLITVAIVILVQLFLYPSVNIMQSASIFSDQRILKTAIFTFFQAGLSTILSLGLGMIFAWSLANTQKFPFRNLLIALMSSALVLPTLVVVLGLVSVYGRSGWIASVWQQISGENLPFSIYGLGGILVAHVFFNASFAARVLLHRFQSIPPQKLKLGASLGLGTIRKFLLIELPTIRPALPALAITIFLLCFTSFAIVLTLGGSPAFNTLEVSIYETVKFDFDLLFAFKLALVQILICIVLVSLASTFSLPDIASFSPIQNGLNVNWTPTHVKIIQAGIIILFATFFLLPLISVVLDGVGGGFIAVAKEPQFLHSLVTSFTIAFTAASLTLILSLALSSAITSFRLSSRIGNIAVARLLLPLLTLSSMLYLVFPALVMGLGFFLLFQKIGGSTIVWAACVVIFANSVTAIPFAVAALRPAIAASGARNDKLCASLGIGFWRRIRLIDVPMLKYEIRYVFALAFCFSLGDLGVISLFASDDFKTLPWLLYQKFGSYRTDDASVIALVMLLLVVAVFSFAQPPATNKTGGRT